MRVNGVCIELVGRNGKGLEEAFSLDLLRAPGIKDLSLSSATSKWVYTSWENGYLQARK